MGDILTVIPVRGGSKGVPGKNIKLLNGRPLLYYTIDAAREVCPDAYICISTDSVEIKKYAEDAGLPVPFLRPDDLAKDNTPSYDVLLHAIHFYEEQGYYPDTLIFLQATSPLRQGHHIRKALALFEESSVDMVVSVKETSSNPYYVLFEEDTNGFLKKSKPSNFTSRQECPPVWEYNGAIFIISVNSLKQYRNITFPRIIKYVMPAIESIDIDTPEDFQFAEIIMKNKNKDN